ncbi:enoyl-CoA hydratase/carnithine racemase [Dongia mobilis]|uniref:Enoyl-CoA hydratase/carnithine racemase n=2 Tax=Dongia mobilis TaxID=578943 RepID=A0A4R6WQH1_9PROT|nr:enoyl-CoA hydratase/carnithine racemase [Dongia mobilis]
MLLQSVVSGWRQDAANAGQRQVRPAAAGTRAVLLANIVRSARLAAGNRLGIGKTTMTIFVESRRDGAVAILRLNRPDKMNALNLAMWQALAEALAAIAADDSVRCVVLEGSGGNFAAGADLAEFAAMRATPAAAEAYGARMLQALWALRDLPQPTIAAIAGNCLGAGLELAAMCDLRIAASDARFGVPIQRVGIAMPYPELAALTQLLGPATMLELLLEGRINDAAWARERGLITRIAPLDTLAADVADSAARIVAGSPSSHRHHKKFIRRSLDPRPVSPAELAESYAAVDSDDYREGIAAFLAKRKPAFTGR